MPYAEQLPSGNWRAIYRLKDGSRRSAGTWKTKRRAQLEASNAEEEATKPGWRDPHSAERTWKEWCEEWWPTRTVEKSTIVRQALVRDKRLMPKWGDVALADITRADVRAWAKELADDGLAPATVQRTVHLLSASLMGAVDAEILPANVAVRLKLPSGQTDARRYLSRDDAQRFLDCFDDSFDRALAYLLFKAGPRWGEAVGLQISRFDANRRLIRIAEVWDDRNKVVKPYPKGRKIRDVPAPPVLVNALTEIIGDRTDGFVFNLGGHLPDYSNWRRKVWLPAMRSAGLEGVRIHDARHTYASHLLQGGVSLEEVGRLLGHVSFQTTMIYAHLKDVDADHIFKALG